METISVSGPFGFDEEIDVGFDALRASAGTVPAMTVKTARLAAIACAVRGARQEISALRRTRIHPTQNNTGSSKRYTTASRRMRLESASSYGYQTVH
jgi:hypothetical protein